ncbi:hypothetical protein, partial [Abiotrophia defectiva]|uniref:hypothetical protein n=1 Tax=Abiotrophia defectiva TaxID=46125 RepID=UPI0028EBED46
GLGIIFPPTLRYISIWFLSFLLMFYSCCSNRLKDKKLPQKPYLKGLFPYFPTISNSEKLFELKKEC